MNFAYNPHKSKTLSPHFPKVASFVQDLIQSPKKFPFSFCQLDFLLCLFNVHTKNQILKIVLAEGLAKFAVLHYLQLVTTPFTGIKSKVHSPHHQRNTIKQHFAFVPHSTLLSTETSI